jgi:hypothetical protein
MPEVAGENAKEKKHAEMSSKSNPKKRITACKEKAGKVASLLNNNAKKGNIDVTEFLNTVLFVDSVLEDYLKAKEKNRPPLPDDGVELENHLDQYEVLLNQLNQSGLFLRFFTSNRVRHKLDRLNAQIHKSTAKIYIALEANKKPKDKDKKTKKSSKSEASEKPTDCIKDDSAKAFWENTFQQVCFPIDNNFRHSWLNGESSFFNCKNV